MASLYLQKTGTALCFASIIGMTILLIGHPFLYEKLRMFCWCGLLVGILCYLGGKRLVLSSWVCSRSVIWAIVVWCASVTFSAVDLGSLSFDIRIYYCGLVVFLVIGLIMSDDARLIKNIALVVLGGAGAVGFYGLLQFYHLDPWPAEHIYRSSGRIVATFTNPNYFGSYVACGLSIGLLFFLSAQKKLSIGLLLGLCGFCYTGLLLSGSRGAWVASLVGSGMVIGGMVVQLRKERNLLPVYRLVMAGALFLFITLWFSNATVIKTPSGSIAVSKRLFSAKNIIAPEPEHDAGIAHRYWIWMITWQMICREPIFGSGYGTFQEKFKEMRGQLQESGALNQVFEDVAFAHNEYLHIWAEGGLVGLLAFLGIVMASLRNITIKNGRKQCLKLEHLGAASVVATLLTHALVSYPLHLELHSMIFGLALGVLSLNKKKIGNQ